MKKILMALIALSFILIPFTTVHAQSEVNTRYISLWSASGEIHVNAGDFIVLGYGWSTCAIGFDNLFRSVVNHELTIDDGQTYIVEKNDKYWSPIVFSEDPYAQQVCIAGNKQGFWNMRWSYPLGVFVSGSTHTVYDHFWMDRPIKDGGDYDGDGKMDYADLSRNKTFTIIVD